MSTHLHVLIRAHPSCSVPRLVMRWKSLSALITRREEIGEDDRPLRWAAGYSVTTVSPAHLELVKRYLDNQPNHHPLDVINRKSPSAGMPELDEHLRRQPNRSTTIDAGLRIPPEFG